MPPFLGLARTCSFRLLHPFLRIYTQNQPERNFVAVCQLHNQIRYLARIAFLTAFDTFQSFRIGPTEASYMPSPPLQICFTRKISIHPPVDLGLQLEVKLIQ
jgi:hypothetical protein